LGYIANKTTTFERKRWLTTTSSLAQYGAFSFTDPLLSRHQTVGNSQIRPLTRLTNALTIAMALLV